MAKKTPTKIDHDHEPEDEFDEDEFIEDAAMAYASAPSRPSRIDLSKLAKVFRCSVCGKIAVVWLSRCPTCQEMNPFDEIDASSVSPEEFDPSRSVEDESQDQEEDDDEEEHDVIIPLGKVDATEPPRFDSGDDGLDHVLGGGLVPGSVVALFGPPGIGKSTLLTKIGVRVAQNFPVIYAAGEESAGRVSRRVARLKLLRDSPDAKRNFLIIEKSTDTDTLCALILEKRPLLAIVDSLASLASERTTGRPGGPSQVSYAAKMLIESAHETGSSILAIGHETKDGRMAGPSVARHDVDTLLALEHIEMKKDGTFKKADIQTGWLRLRADGKNRDGDTSAFALYKMTEHGLVGLEDLGMEAPYAASRSSEAGKPPRKKNGNPPAKSKVRDDEQERVERPVLPRKGRGAGQVRPQRKRRSGEDVALP